MSVGKYLFNVAKGIDQLINAIRGGDPDETLSGTLGKLKKANGGKIPWRFPFARTVDSFLELIDPGHSIDAIEADEGKDSCLPPLTKPPEMDYASRESSSECP